MPPSLVALDYFPHKFCLMLNWRLIWLEAISDQLIAISYFVIGGLLLVLCLRPLKLAKFIMYISMVGSWVLRTGGIAFGLFIVACGGTHQVGAITIWLPIYEFEGALKVLTAGLSLATMVGFVSLVHGFIRAEGGVRVFVHRFIHHGHD